MKNLVLATVITLSAFASAQAEQVCGILASDFRSPACPPNAAACSHAMMKEFYISTESGNLELGAANMKVLGELSQDEGKDICVVGSVNAKSGEMIVRSISLQNK